MSFFNRFEGSRLFVADPVGDEPGWLAYLIPADGSVPGDGVDLADALDRYGGSFLVSAPVPSLADAAAITIFVAAIDAVIQRSPVSRGIIWLADLANIAGASAMLGLSANGSQTAGGLAAPIVPGLLTVNLLGGTAVSLTGDVLGFSGSGSVIAFAGSAAPSPGQASQVASATLPFRGPRRGCLVFGEPFYLARPFLAGSFGWGFQFLVPTPQSAVRTDYGMYLPLGSGILPHAGDMIGFAVSIDPSDPFGLHGDLSTPALRTALVFTGTNQDTSATTIVSGYATTTGAPLQLVPVAGPVETEPRAARLVFNLGAPGNDSQSNFQLAPDGDFVIALDAAVPAGPCGLLCGLHGTEFVRVVPRSASYPGDRFTFTSRRCAYVPQYPFPDASPLKPPVDPNASLLDPTYRTSWAGVIRDPAIGGAVSYVAQPKGAPLYGRDDAVYAARKSLFGSMDIGIELHGGMPAVPMVPYGLATPQDGIIGFTSQQIETFEASVIGPTRRQLIGSGATGAARASVADDAAPFNTTTPSGLLVTVGTDGRWSKILLGQNLSPELRQMCFCAPDANLQQAFQTGQLFLVVANGVHLGAPSTRSDGTCGTDPTFQNQMNIGDWLFEADVGQSNRYGDYASVMIVKGRRGRLYDPVDPSASLVAAPDQWTAKDVLAAPSDVAPGQTVPGCPDPSELVILSAWLQAYFADAAGSGDTAFARFNAIAKDDGWTGILVLAMTIKALPTSLVGIRAGVRDPGRFRAHHFGIEISQVANDPDAASIELKDSSSMFGLINYVDPDYTPPLAGAQPQAVASSGADPYDFRLLSLKALFLNSAVQSFESTAQLRLATLFGMPVDHMGAGGNAADALVLRGSYQDNGGQSIYSLGTTATSSFYFTNNLFTKIQVDSAQMSTRDDGSQSGNVVAWFGLAGFLDFAIVSAQDGTAFDLLSFGSAAGKDEARQGLAFANLGLLMSFPMPAPGAPVTGIEYAFVSDAIRFDLATSTPRKGSVFSDFALGLDGLVAGDASATPEGAGYLTVITDARLSGVAGGSWYGLGFSLDMGSPGALAGSVGLKSSLLAAWSTVSARASAGATSGTSAGPIDYQALLGIKLPGTGGGAKLISLQSVLKLSIGQIRLTRSSGTFLLMLTEIALKFLGLLKIPPNGSSLFYLFGNPKGGGASGLGWYAMYRKDKPKAPAQLVDQERV